MSKRVLVVDDEQNIRMLYDAELTAEGYEVTVAESGDEALVAVSRNRPDIVVLDVKLADDDGLDILSSIRKEDRTLPIVLNSAYSVYKADFNSWLADAYVVKSSDLTELKSRIRELLG